VSGSVCFARNTAVTLVGDTESKQKSNYYRCIFIVTLGPAEYNSVHIYTYIRVPQTIAKTLHLHYYKYTSPIIHTNVSAALRNSYHLYRSSRIYMCVCVCVYCVHTGAFRTVVPTTINFKVLGRQEQTLVRVLRDEERLRARSFRPQPVCPRLSSREHRPRP